MSDKMREEFVRWLESLDVGYDTRFMDFIGGLGDGEFYDGEVQGLWTCWQASRAAVVIELPSADEFDVPSFAHDAIVGCWNAIEAAGLKVKP